MKEELHEYILRKGTHFERKYMLTTEQLLILYEIKGVAENLKAFAEARYEAGEMSSDRKGSYTRLANSLNRKISDIAFTFDEENNR